MQRAPASRVGNQLGLLLAGLVAFVLVLPPFALAAPTRTIRVNGLEQRAEIIRDKWGIPHIYGRTPDDMFFAQGFNAARDRLWQLDQWRRQGEGKLAEAFGPRFVDKDRAARLFLYRGDLDEEFRSYHPRGKEIVQAFVNGINAYVDYTRAHPEALPLEFKLTGSQPGYWSITTPLIRIYGLTRNLSREIALSRQVVAMGADLVEKLSLFQPPAHLTVPKGVDLSLIGSSSITDYNLARGGVTFLPSDIVAKNVSADEKVRLAQAMSRPSLDATDNPMARLFESNNWTISGRLTSTGHPILSGDPHRTQSVPSLRYIAHLNGPGWNVIGAGEPALPGISLGHNDDIAYALTIFAFADEEDLYVYDTNPANPNQYLYRGQWEDMRIVNDTIPVKGAAAAPVQLRFTRHGPVISADAAHNKAYALRAAYLEFPGTAVYLASLRVDQANNWETFTKAMEKHYCPSENMVYADRKGNIGWFGGSIAPLRANWNGMLPVAGNGEYEWQGFLPAKYLPRIENPSQGFFASANQYNIPPGYSFTDISAHEWSDSFRFDRITEVLSAGRNFGLEDSERLQYDDTSLPARALVPMLAGATSLDPDVADALAQLRTWDFVLSKDSVAATIYEFWVTQVHTDVFALYVPAAARSIFGSGNRTVLIRLLQNPDAAFGADPYAGRTAVLLKSLTTAVNKLKTAYGTDRSAWEWGKLHHETLTHILSGAVDPATAAKLDVGPLPQSGDGFTPHATSFSSDFNQTSGASYREVIDLQDFDRSVTLNNPGQSGDPSSPHYQDLFPLWAEGKFVPMLFSREKILDAADEILVLQPDHGQGD